MNETFNIRRLGKLFVYEVTNYLPNFVKSLIIASGVLVAVWLLSLVASMDILDNGRDGLIGSLYIVMIVISPYIIYKDMNNRKKGYIYAMMPASTLEKLLSMLIVCGTAVPVVVYLSLTLTDVVLYAFSQLGMGTFEKLVFYHPFEFWKISFDYEGAVSTVLWIDDIMTILSAVTTAMMFNSIFRKNKIFKTVLFNIIVVFGFTIIALLVSNVISPEFIERFSSWVNEYFNSFSMEQVENFLMWIMRVSCFVWIAVTLGITYYRIKKVNY